MLTRFILLIICYSSISIGELTEKEIRTYRKDTEIGDVRISDFKNEDRKRSEVLEINTYRNEDHQTNFQIHILAEVTDKNKDSYLVEYRANQSEVDSEFTGEEYYELYIPNGYLGKLKVTAFAVIYGVLLEGEFTSLAEEYDDVESVQELKIRTDRKFPLSVSLKHYHIYDNGNDEESIKSTLRNLIKE